jgi:hypothetical protein
MGFQPVLMNVEVSLQALHSISRRVSWNSTGQSRRRCRMALSAGFFLSSNNNTFFTSYYGVECRV